MRQGVTVSLIGKDQERLEELQKRVRLLHPCALSRTQDGVKGELSESGLARLLTVQKLFLLSLNVVGCRRAGRNGRSRRRPRKRGEEGRPLNVAQTFVFLNINLVSHERKRKCRRYGRRSMIAFSRKETIPFPFRPSLLLPCSYKPRPWRIHPNTSVCSSSMLSQHALSAGQREEEVRNCSSRRLRPRRICSLASSTLLELLKSTPSLFSPETSVPELTIFHAPLRSAPVRSIDFASPPSSLLLLLTILLLPATLIISITTTHDQKTTLSLSLLPQLHLSRPQQQMTFFPHTSPSTPSASRMARSSSTSSRPRRIYGSC
jgi:hypothetical protein